MITCHPKKIPKFLLKGGVVQFCPVQAIEVVGERLFSTQNTKHKRENQAALSKIFNTLLGNCGRISHKKTKGKVKRVFPISYYPMASPGVNRVNKSF